MQFVFTDPQTEFEHLIGGHYYINVFDRIRPGDDIRFAQFLDQIQPPPRTTVYIDSTGGDVDAAIGIGRTIRNHWFSTAIGRYVVKYPIDFDFMLQRELLDGRCLSAATLIFIGGRLRHFRKNDKFGVHQFGFNDPSPDNAGRSQILSAKIAQYVAEMGVSAELMMISSAVESDNIKLLDEDTLRRLHIVTGGETDAAWSTQSRGDMLYIRGERDSIYGHHKCMLCFTRESGFLFYSVIEAQGRERELTTFPMVEIAANREDIRIDISDRCQRVVHNGYVNIFAKLSRDEAHIIAYSDSFGVQIRISAEASMFFGVSPMSTEGGREQLETFYRVLSKYA